MLQDYADGYPFHMLSPSKIVKLQLAIPKTAKLLRRYAEETEGPVKEMYQVHPNITCEKGNGFHCTKLTAQF